MKTDQTQTTETAVESVAKVPETDRGVESQTQVESQTLPETHNEVAQVTVVVDTVETQPIPESPATVELSVIAAVSGQPDEPDNQLGLESPARESEPSTSKPDVAEALCRMSTVDLQDGTRPPQSLLAPEAGSQTAVLMSLGGVLQPVTVPLTVKQCQEAGLTLANQSEAMPVQPAPKPAPTAPTPPPRLQPRRLRSAVAARRPRISTCGLSEARVDSRLQPLRFRVAANGLEVHFSSSGLALRSRLAARPQGEVRGPA